MWNRAELKEKAKKSISHNYWRVILVTLIVFMIGGATSVDFSFNFEIPEEDVSSFEEQFEEQFKDAFEDAYEDAYEDSWEDAYGDVSDMEYSDLYYVEDASNEYWDGYYDGYFGNERQSDAIGDYSDGYNDGILDDYYENGDISSDVDSVIEENLPSGLGSAKDLATTILGIASVILVLVTVIIAIVVFFINVFFFNPLEVGTKRFFVKNLSQPAEVKEVAYAYDNSYKNVIKILFIRDMCIIGWSLLFIIPGIVKAYEYLMIPYLLAENPNLTKDQAFTLSKQMMTGQKWKAFVLHLSFIGWDFLSSLTLGILGIFYVQPYRCLTFAALYEELNIISGYPARALAQSNMTNPYTQTEYQTPVYEQQVQPDDIYTETTSTTEDTYNSPE